MGDSMKLDKWPEEVEVDGWRWGHGSRHYVCDTGQCTVQYVRLEKLHVPPTMREIMEHLLKGGIVRFGEEEPANCYFYRIDQIGELYGKTGGAGDSWSRRRGISDRRDDNSHLWFLEEIAK